MNSEIQLGKTKNHHPKGNKTEDFPSLKDWAVGIIIYSYPKGGGDTWCLGVSVRGKKLAGIQEQGRSLARGSVTCFFPSLTPGFRGLPACCCYYITTYCL